MMIQSSGRYSGNANSHRHQFHFNMRNVRIVLYLTMISLVTSACTNRFQDAKVLMLKFRRQRFPLLVLWVYRRSIC